MEGETETHSWYRSSLGSCRKLANGVNEMPPRSVGQEGKACC